MVFQQYVRSVAPTSEYTPPFTALMYKCTRTAYRIVDAVTFSRITFHPVNALTPHTALSTRRDA